MWMCLRRISDVLKSVVYLNDPTLVSFIVSVNVRYLLLYLFIYMTPLLKDEVFLDFAGALEFDPALRERGNYRSYLSSDRALPKKALTRQSFAHGDQAVMQCALRLFRLRFTKEVMLRPLIDESGAAAISNAIAGASVDICDMVRP